ncbi:MmgE/PrpD family protein [Nocardioides sp. LHD-245]|uniref:MmgE/PrpD family protein n=1 Tax=Nocardioides sp. LHD-245 TaxID=3051387 RepID=UPI0027E185C0|nr:MmgE/PrpD family protein [Nocardioides sp. LHD-245]
MTTTRTEDLGAFVAGLDLATVPDDVVETTRLAVAHNLAVAAAGGRLAAVALRWSESRWGGHGARTFLTGAELAPPDAAFVNACLVHARAQDDTYFPGFTHVGAATIPAVLALAEATDRSLRDVLTAVVAGYEVAAAVGRVAALRTTAHGFRGSGIYGVFGAAAGAARLLGLDAEQCAHALGIAASMAAGTNQTWVDGSSEWQLQLGAASRSGLEAARLAACGATGSAAALEGDSGFFAAFVRDLAPADGVGRELGTVWATREVTFKAHPVCAILQEPVTAAASLVRTARTARAPFAGATLTLSPAEAHYPGTDGMPVFEDAGAALMSARYCLATALTRGSVTVDDLFASGEPERVAGAQRVEVVADPRLGPREFVLEVTWTDGRTDRATGAGVLRAWARPDLEANLHRLQGEVPEGIDLAVLAGRALGGLDLPAAELVDAVVAH